MNKFSFAVGFTCGLALLLSAGTASADIEAARAPHLLPAAGSPLLVTMVERELAAAPADGGSLEKIYRLTVRTEADAASFFYSATFLRLGLAAQQQIIEAALALDPVSFVLRTEFLPVSLRSEYRAKARAAAGDIQLRRVAAMSAADQALLYLPSRAGMRGGADGEAFDPAGQLRRFRRDPALARFAAVDAAWVAEIAGPFTSAAALVEAKVILTRGLAAQRLAPSRANAALVWRELEAERGRLAGLKLFGGRHVVFAAGKDESQGAPTFGKASTLAALRSQGPASLDLLRSGERGAEASLARAIARDGELTLVLETHGRPGALEFGGALGPDELAAMFAARPAGSPAIVIVNACFGHDFARAFAERLERRGLPLPILIVPEEFGQATVIGRQESAFTRELGIGGGVASTLAGLWPGNHPDTAVYAPVGNQLAQLR